MRSTVEFRYAGKAGDSIYHVNDKWIEPQKNPTAGELDAYIKKIATEALSPREGRPPADVIFADLVDFPALLASVKAGAVLVTYGDVHPESNSPFGALWPAKALKESNWMSEGARRAEDAIALSGLPIRLLRDSTYLPLDEPTPGSTALSANMCGSVYTRKVGKGSIVYVPTGPISRYWEAIASFGRKYDHDDIWLRLWDQLLYETVRGADAIPAFSDLGPGAKEAGAGQVYALPGRIINRTARGPLAVSVHVTNPRGGVVYSADETVEAPARGTRPYAVHVPVAADWPAGLYPVYLTVGDPVAKVQFHQALEFIPIAGQLRLELKADKKGYRLGEEAKFTLTGSSGAPWDGSVHFGVYDFRGRLLATANQAARFVTNQPQEFTFRTLMADQGVRVDTLWAEVVARKDGREWGRAEAKIYKYEPWNMRNEYQWSTWAGTACAPPSLVPRAMRLMAHAGLNALGYPGRSELYYPAERWGWRSYNEGIGMNTFSPVIEFTSDAEIEAALLKEAEPSFNSRDMNSATFILGSVGEEAGYKDGWGKTYYWDTPVAPEKSCRAFQWYLKGRYGEISKLNATWKTAYRSWDEVKLTREFSEPAPKLESDGWAHPKQSPLGPDVTAVSLAPYSDTVQFYAWYYDRFVTIAKRILRHRINPVPLTMASAPASWIFDSRACDVRLAGPNAWNESQMHSLMDGKEPGFGLIWGHFDWQVKTDNMFWGFLLGRCGHNNYWVDVPLMFNADLTHTRASFAIRRWTQRFAGHERIILDSVPSPSDAAVLGPTGLGTDEQERNMSSSLQVALAQGGFGLPASSATDLGKYKIAFAVGRQAVSKEEAARLQAFVERGGVLTFTSRFATQDEFGSPHSVCPGHGLAEKWNLRTSAEPASPPEASHSAALDGLGERFKGLKLTTAARLREKVKQTGWSPLAQYEDETPAVLTRTLGGGRLYYVNAAYQSHWYIQWVTPTGPERQGFYRLVEWLCNQAEARRTLRLEGDLSQLLHVAVKQFTDPTGDIGYVVVRTSGEVPWVAGQLKWLGPQTAGYDVLDGRAVGRDVPLNFKPGTGKLLAFVEKPVKQVRVSASPAKIVAGEPLQIEISVLGADDTPVRGRFPLEIRVRAQNRREIEGLRRSISQPSGGKFSLQTSLSDPAGTWTITAIDGISGLSGSCPVSVTVPPGLAAAPGFVPWGWPSEIFEPVQLTPGQFVDRLRALARLYRTDQSGTGWMAKQRLCYYYDYFPGTRHALLQPLLDADWGDYAGAVRQAVSDGTELIFTGEDLGIHPGSGLEVYPHHDAGQFAALRMALDGATWHVASADGDTVVATLGRGRTIFCRESVDAAGHDNPSAVRWQQRWLQELKTEGLTRLSPPTRTQFLRWWIARESLAGRRIVTWFEGNHRELKFTLEPDHPSGEVFCFVVPPTGDVKEVVVHVTGTGADKLRFDVGCDNVTDTDWQAVVALQARSALYRDDNGWRIIPVRVTAETRCEVHLRIERVVVE
jgi:hypothetical protein